jgi:hypothetical protein
MNLRQLYPEHLDDGWEEDAPDRPFKARRVNGMVKITGDRSYVTYYYRGFALSYDAKPEWHIDGRERFTRWSEISGAIAGADTATEMKANIDEEARKR